MATCSSFLGVQKLDSARRIQRKDLLAIEDDLVKTAVSRLGERVFGECVLYRIYHAALMLFGIVWKRHLDALGPTRGSVGFVSRLSV